MNTSTKLGSYTLSFSAHVGAWMDLRIVGPATRKDFATAEAAAAAARMTMLRCAAIQSFEVHFHELPLGYGTDLKRSTGFCGRCKHHGSDCHCTLYQYRAWLAHNNQPQAGVYVVPPETPVRPNFGLIAGIMARALESMLDTYAPHRQRTIDREGYDALHLSVRDAMEALKLASPIPPPPKNGLVLSALVEALSAAESFIAGFEGDETQDGVDALLEQIRTAIELGSGGVP